MSWLDIIILLPLIIGLVRGLMRGLVMEIASIVAVVLGYVGSRLWGGIFAAWLMQQFSWPEAVCAVVAYALLFIGISLVLHIAARLLSKFFQKVSLGWLNRLMGGLFGVLKWAIIVLALVLCIHRLDEQFQFFKEELKQQSIVYTHATPIAEKMWDSAKQQIAVKQHTETKDTTVVQDNQ